MKMMSDENKGQMTPDRDGLLVSITTKPFGEGIESKYEVFDRETENVFVKLSYFDDLNDGEFFLTYSKYLLNKIKKYMKEPSLLLEQEEDGYIQESGIFILDGINTEVDLFIEDRCRRFLYSNLDGYKEYLDNYPQTQTVYKIVSCVTREAYKQIRRKMKQDEGL